MLCFVGLRGGMKKPNLVCIHPAVLNVCASAITHSLGQTLDLIADSVLPSVRQLVSRPLSRSLPSSLAAALLSGTLSAVPRSPRTLRSGPPRGERYKSVEVKIRGGRHGPVHVSSPGTAAHFQTDRVPCKRSIEYQSNQMFLTWLRNYTRER